MRFLFGGIALFIVISLIVGRIFSPRGSTMRTVFGRGFYYTVASTLVLAVVWGIGALIYFAIFGDNIHDTGFFKGMNEEQKTEYLDSLFNNLPNPSVAEVKTAILDYRFNSKALPCYEALHAFDVASLEQIVNLKRKTTESSHKVYEIITAGEFKTDRPERGFHLKGDFAIQYTFSEGLRDVPPGWHFTKIYFIDCRVLSEHSSSKAVSRDSLYPDLHRD